ncbi:MAG: arginine--tRNA ligase, partial [Alphaproteobacteria bacterium]|nr:arginine--tRNA ligase [Alphaproteobacteria bacterium]
MNLFSHFLGVIRSAAEDLAAEASVKLGDLSRVTAEPPREAAHGDIASNAAMVLNKEFGKPPRVLADLLAGKLAAKPHVASVEVAGPGFINIRLKPEFWPVVLDAALKLGDDFGRSAVGRGIKANVEYVSANPTGPLHVGHVRGAVFGDALAALLAFAGYEVTKEYYINDAGAQVDVVARSAYLRYREALGEEIGEIPAGLYPGEYLKPVGAALAKEFGATLLDKSDRDWLPLVRERVIALMMEMIRGDLAALDIR